MPKAKSSSKKTANANGDAATNGTVSKKNTTSALQTSSAPESNASQVKAQRPPVTETNIYPSVNEDTIRHRAYELYMQRGGQHGGHVDDWYRAEAELRSRH